MDQSSPADDDSWFCAGPVSSFSDLAFVHNQQQQQQVKLSTAILPCVTNDHSNTTTATTTDRPTSATVKIFQIPRPVTPTSSAPFQIHLQSSTPTTSSSTSSSPSQSPPSDSSLSLPHQILIFKHRSKFHAIDHQCPHQSYPLSQGSIYDIEDFGIVLSAGVVCPRHGWAFDLFTGESDRGVYSLRVWEVEVRERTGVEEVWVKWR